MQYAKIGRVIPEKLISGLKKQTKTPHIIGRGGLRYLEAGNQLSKWGLNLKFL